MNEEAGLSVQDLFHALWRRKWTMLLVFMLVLAAGLVFISRIPVVYRSSALILVEQQEIPTQWVNSTVVSFADERIQAIGQQVLTTNNLWRIVEKFGMFPDMRGFLSQEQLVSIVRENFHTENVQASIRDRQSGARSFATVAFRLSYDDPDPALAKNVATELANLYLGENLKSRTEAARDTRLFLEAEADRLEQDLANIEEKISKFKEENFGSLPEHQEINIQAYQRTEEQLADTAQLLASLEERRIILESSIDSAERLLRSGRSSIATSATAAVDPRVDRLATLKAEYINLQTRYSQDHPNLIRLGREIALLEDELGITVESDLSEQLADLRLSLDAARNRYSEEHPEVIRLTQAVALMEQQVSTGTGPEIDTTASVEGESTPTGSAMQSDPAYIRLTTDLRSVLTEQDSIRERRRELQAKLVALDQEINKSPEVEREYRALVRDHENIQNKYNDIREKQNSARVAESLELEQKSERFTLIEDPRVPDHPYSPNYRKLLLMVLGGAMASGVAAALGLETLDSRVRNIRGLESLTGVPVLAAVNVIETPRDRRRRFMKFLLVVILILTTIGLLLFLVNFYDISREDVEPRILLEQLRNRIETLNLPGI